MSYESLKGHETTVLRNVTAVKTEKVQGKMGDKLQNSRCCLALSQEH